MAYVTCFCGEETRWDTDGYAICPDHGEKVVASPTGAQSFRRDVAQPRAGSIRDAYGDPCPAAKTPDLYPLAARCERCNTNIRCASGDAEWYHKRSGQAACR